MKQYKLIKKYPSIPSKWDIGMLVGIGDFNYQYSPCNGDYTNIYIPKNEVENYPEFWELIEEHKFKILSFIGKGKKIPSRILNPINGLYKLHGAEHTREVSLNYLLQTDYLIYSFERCSDGEIFTIGDVYSHIVNNRKQIINNFYYDINIFINPNEDFKRYTHYDNAIKHKPSLDTLLDIWETSDNKELIKQSSLYKQFNK